MPAPGRLIGRGLTAEVFEFGSGCVLKLFFPARAPEKVQQEFRNTCAVHALGLPVPRALDQIRLQGREGLVFERIDGPSMFHAVQGKPWRIFDVAREFAELHFRVNSCAAPPELPGQRAQIEEWLRIAGAQIGPNTSKRVRELVSSLPARGGQLCHGDFHPGNVICGKRGPVLIDWSAATSGTPLGDAARTAALLAKAEIPPGTPFAMRFLVRVSRCAVHNAYLRHYFRRAGGTTAELAPWEPVQELARAVWRTNRSL